jgi:16S rRNA (uracil1498-N3)-methyltransferase
MNILSKAQETAQAAQLTLALSLIKPARFEQALEKAAELGVSCLSPLITHRCTIRLNAARRKEKPVRWQRIADEAAQQCGRSIRMLVEPIRPFADWLKLPDKPKMLIPTLAGETVSLSQTLQTLSPMEPLAVLIGPEGDFTPQEVQLAVDCGAIPVSLGPLTLRSETAAIALVSIVQQHRLAW